MNWESLLQLAQAGLMLGLLGAWLTALIQVLLNGRLPLLFKRPLCSRFWMGWGMLPAALGSLVAAFVMTFGILSGLGWLSDHCLSHAGHPHICLRHISDLPPGGWMAWTLLAVATGRVLWISRGPVRQLARLKQISRGSLWRRSASGTGVRLLPGTRPLAFTAGAWTPEIFWTEAVERLLEEDEQEIVLAHEESHRRQRDPLQGLALYLLQRSLSGSEAIFDHWRREREMECDQACLEEGHDPTRVAATILKMQRAAVPAAPSPLALDYVRTCDSSQLRQRIECLLQPREKPRGLGIPALCAAALGVGLVLQAPAAHHMLETILGWFYF